MRGLPASTISSDDGRSDSLASVGIRSGRSAVCRRHLPDVQDETCFFLAIDFDKEGWREDARAFLETCRALGVPAVLERSRSGQGGHVWVFFEEAITAASARRLGSFVLTETMERRPDLGFSSYDRFFPNQDTLPHGGFGNLIALPLQKQPRDVGNTVFEQVVRRAKAKFVTGLSATVTRKDGHHPIIFMQCGPVRHRVDAKVEAIRRPFTHSVLVRPTAFQTAMLPPSNKHIEFTSLYAELVGDESRNRRICEDVIEAVHSGRSPLVLTERNEHLVSLAKHFEGRVDHVIVLRGGMGKKQREALAAEIAAVSTEQGRVILATGRYIGEGFDDARLDTLFLTLPVSWHGTIAQYAGRLHRLYDGKREVRIYDYADLNEPMLARMFDRRCRGYEAVGYSISLPASAVPGWPADVVLPSDPEWKRDYAATVRRLIRDGVDTPLANLFVRAVKPSLPEATGIERARSASEAFLGIPSNAELGQRIEPADGGH
jgi:hypothetical protein